MRSFKIDTLIYYQEVIADEKASGFNFLGTFQKIFKNISDSLPTVVGFIGFVIFAWLFTKIFLFVVKKILAKSNIDQLSEKLSETKIFGDSTINIVFTKIIITVLRWFLIMIFVMAGSEMFGLKAVSDGLKSFFAYLPRLITALMIFATGVYLGTIIKKAIQSMFKSLDINGGNLVANIAFYLIVVFLSITALDQAGIDTSIIKNNLTMVIGSVLLAFTIAFGLGAREPVSRLLYGYYSRKNIQIGSTIRIEEIEGIVTAIDNICLILETKEGNVVFPIKDLVDNKLIIKK